MYDMPVTKESLIRYFSQLDLATLQKLEKYSRLLIIPDEDLLVNVTMSQMVDKAHELADVLFPEWTDRSKSDFGEFLVELFALFSEKDFWYINAFANEGILRKMRSYSNAFSKASSMGYNPRLCRGATASFTVTFAEGEAVTYGRGDLMLKVNGKKFTNDESFSVESSGGSINKVLTLHEGVQVAEDVTFNGYCIFLRKPNIDIDSIRIVIGNVAYDRVGTFGQSDNSSTHYMVLPEEDGSCSIYFGDGVFGVRPAIGTAIRVEYRTCNGAEGNIELSEIEPPTVEVSDSLPEREATAVSMTTEAAGGTFAESLNSIKEKAPVMFGTRGTAVNKKAVEALIKTLPFVHKACAVVAGSSIAYSVIPKSGLLEPTAAQISEIDSLLLESSMLGFNEVYSPNSYINLLHRADPQATKIIADVIISTGYNSTAIESSVREIIEGLTDPYIEAEYGGSFNKTDVDILVRSRVLGVQSVSFKTLYNGVESVMQDVILQGNEIFTRLNSEYLQIRINVI